MSNATLVVTATLTGGAATRDIELQQLQHAVDLAAQQARRPGGTVTSGTATAEFNSVSATWTYTAVASK